MNGTSRRSFLQKMGMGAAAVWAGVLQSGHAARGDAAGERAAAGQDGEPGSSLKGKRVRVPMSVDYDHAWLSWVASVTGCLRALGVACDHAEVAGYSGYAFMLNVGPGVHPSGPTAFDWGLLDRGVSCLGRSAQVFHGFHCPCEMKTEEDAKRVRGEMWAAYEIAAGEIAAGRPCVVWGTYDPDFGIVVGVEDGAYLVETFRRGSGEPQPAIRYDQLVTPSGSYVLAFPTVAEIPRRQGDRDALFHAVTMLNYRRGDPQYANGQAAYDRWIACLDEGKAEAHGNSYNAHCWAEARGLARDFLKRVSARNQAESDLLAGAVAAYGEVSDALAKLTDLFPFPDGDRKVDDPQVRAKAMEALHAAKAADARATEALSQAVREWPRG